MKNVKSSCFAYTPVVLIRMVNCAFVNFASTLAPGDELAVKTIFAFQLLVFLRLMFSIFLPFPGDNRPLHVQDFSVLIFRSHQFLQGGSLLTFVFIYILSRCGKFITCISLSAMIAKLPQSKWKFERIKNSMEKWKWKEVNRVYPIRFQCFGPAISKIPDPTFQIPISRLLFLLP